MKYKLKPLPLITEENYVRISKYEILDLYKKIKSDKNIIAININIAEAEA